VATTNVKKTITDVGYIVVGLGVMGVQQAQRSGRELRAYLNRTGACVQNRTKDAQNKVTETSRTAREQATAQVRTTVDTTVGAATAVRDKVQSQLNDLPERVVQAMEPVTAHVREFGGTSAA
jgi:hypothetical protein